MCHHLSKAERERLQEVEADYDAVWMAPEEDEPMEDDTDTEPDPVPTPS